MGGMRAVAEHQGDGGAAGENQGEEHMSTPATLRACGLNGAMGQGGGLAGGAGGGALIISCGRFSGRSCWLRAGVVVVVAVLMTGVGIWGTRMCRPQARQATANPASLSAKCVTSW